MLRECGEGGIANGPSEHRRHRCGYWGKNVVRTFHNLGALRCVCDVRSQVLDCRP